MLIIIAGTPLVFIFAVALIYLAGKRASGGDMPTVMNAVLSIAGGVLLGIIVSWVVNCTLAEISFNTFFSVYFGILFTAIGGVIIWRIRSKAHPIATVMRRVLIGFAILVIISGSLCIFLDTHWFHFRPAFKVPLYSLLGMSVCFAFTFSFMDLLNWLVGACQNSDSVALVESKEQVHLVLGTSIVMGFIFGLIFGIMDVEDKHGWALRNALITEEHYCLPVGLIIGGIAGYFNSVLRGSGQRQSTQARQWGINQDDNL
jgi:hypothetical protein